MEVNYYISALIQYGLCKKLFEPCDKTYIANRIIEIQEEGVLSKIGTYDEFLEWKYARN